MKNERETFPMIREFPRYPALMDKNYFARIPIDVDNFEKVVDAFNSENRTKELLIQRAQDTAKIVKLEQLNLHFTERGLQSVTASWINCACIGIDARDWEERDYKNPAYTTHNVDTQQEYLALVFTVFDYLNVLDSVARKIK